MKHCYVYDGPVLSFGKIVSNNWHGSTWAISPQKAASNLAYQFKQQMGLVAGAKISLAHSPILHS